MIYQYTKDNIEHIIKIFSNKDNKNNNNNNNNNNKVSWWKG